MYKDNHDGRENVMADSTIALRKSKEIKLSEISTKEREIATLTADIQQLKAGGSGKGDEVKHIEKMLDAKYADFRRQHPIDRNQEPEISRFVSMMNSAVSSASGSYNSSAQSELNSMRYASF